MTRLDDFRKELEARGMNPKQVFGGIYLIEEDLREASVVPNNPLVTSTTIFENLRQDSASFSRLSNAIIYEVLNNQVLRNRIFDAVRETDNKWYLNYIESDVDSAIESRRELDYESRLDMD